jgi:tetratricopeptide (TPR) repeat protein
MERGQSEQNALLNELEAKWNKLLEASSKGLAFYSEYIQKHFTPSHYQLILTHIKELQESFLSNFLSHRSPIFLSKEIANSIYYVAKKALSNEQFVPAYYLFYLLSILTPECFDAWIGFGLTCQQLKKHDEAILAFAEAKRLHPQSVFSYLYTAESYHELKNWSLAKTTCEEGLKFAAKGQERFYEALKSLLNQCEQGK